MLLINTPYILQILSSLGCLNDLGDDELLVVLVLNAAVFVQVAIDVFHERYVVVDVCVLSPGNRSVKLILLLF